MPAGKKRSGVPQVPGARSWNAGHEERATRRRTRRAEPASAVALAASDDRAAAQAPGRWRALRPATLRARRSRRRASAPRVRRRRVRGAGGDTTRAVERYDLRANLGARGRSRSPSITPRPRRGAGLYVVGGYRGGGALSRESAALPLRPARNRWASCPGCRRPAALSAGRDRQPALRGRRAAAASIATLEIFDLRKSAGARAGDARPRAPRGRRCGRRLYVVAGRAAGEATSARRALRPAPTAGRAAGPDPQARGNIAAAAGGRIVVIGGEEGAGTIREVEAFDPPGRWRRLSDMRTPRHGLGAVGYRGRVYAIAGGPQPGFSYSRAIEALSLGGQSPQ